MFAPAYYQAFSLILCAPVKSLLTANKYCNNQKLYMLCGHVHNTADNGHLEKLSRVLRKETDEFFQPCAQIYNVGCLMPWMQYPPQTLDEINKRWEEYHKEK